MNKHARRIWAGLAAALALCAAALAQAPDASAPLTTLIIVRHAEREASTAPESQLTGKGWERSRELARVLKEAGITRVLVSEYIRTQQTAEAVAAELKIKPEIVAVQTGVDVLLERIRELRGEKVLVISHTGRIESLLEKLTGEKFPPMADSSYDSLFVLAVPVSGPARVLTLKYGAH